MGQSVGRLNATWMAKNAPDGKFDKNSETDLHFSDPAEALAQVIQYCQEFLECREARKVLLASMSQSKIYDLLSELKSPQILVPYDVELDMVIGEADPSHKTGNRSITYPQKNSPRSEQKRQPRRDQTDGGEVSGGALVPVLVPGDHIKGGADPYDLLIRLQTAQVKRGTGNYLISLTNTQQEDPVSANLLDEETLVDPAKSTDRQELLTWLASPQPNPGGYQDLLEEVGLEQMRRTCDTPVALLQHRDVFLSPRMFDFPLSMDGFFAVMNAIFWKGDEIHCSNIPGSAITLALQQSETNRKQDNLGLTSGLSKGWALAARGIAAGEASFVGKTSLIQGQYMDPKALYGVALTDFLAYGDTGYPSFQGAEPVPDEPLFEQTLYPLADNVADHYLKPRNPKLKIMTSLPAKKFLDERIPSPPAPPANANQGSFGQWANGLLIFKSHDELTGFARNNPEMQAQQGPFWMVDLYKLDAGYSLFAHNGNEASIGTRFPGVSGIDVTPTDSASLSFDYEIRAQRSWARWSAYGESDLNYGNKSQRQSSGAYTRSQTANYGSAEFGATWNFRPGYRNPSGWKVLLPAFLDTQVIDPRISVPFTATKAQILTAPRAYYLAARPGF